jgi:hypothetical protein
MLKKKYRKLFPKVFIGEKIEISDKKHLHSRKFNYFMLKKYLYI